ncbi:MAG: prepilin-type N-terminal cleavage/methylation domain-containing protein [Candidatus Pacebacteria bacterium]|nr:prepilin-type N-terminal cleavage/methylation domain-containing protein [Candidatus Paceibacterota bacterium]
MSMVRNNKNGFTLTELLVVIGIMAVLAAVGWPAITSLQPSLKLNGVSRELVTNLRSAQQRAVSEQVEYSLRFFPDDNSYRISRLGDTPLEILNKKLPVDIRIFQVSGFTNQEVIFNVLGAVSETGSVALKNSREQSKTIEVRPSGFIKIQ